MALSTFSVRMDEDLKKQFDRLCLEFGMTASTAFNIFARAVVRQRRIPFEIAADEQKITREGALKAFLSLRSQAQVNGLTDMSLQEINEEIDLARAQALL